ncbi:MAG: CPBP family intramembrane metalloprotease [Ignavibacteriales bacterium]|nr:CPBP family intramembrane metalloprotease [Ignavibacteriales bacterium]
MSYSEAVSPPAPPARPASFVDRFDVHPLLFVAVCLGAIFFLYHIVGSAIAFIVVGAKITRENAPAMRLMTTSGQIAFMLLPTLVFARLLSARLGQVFPLRLPSVKEFVFVFVALVSLQQLLEVYMFVQDLIPLPEFLSKVLEPAREMFRNMMKVVVKAESIPELFFVIVIAAVVPSVVEELLFRGVVQKAMERMFQPLLAALLTGVVFGVFHLDPFNAIPLIVIGCFLGVLRHRSQSVILPVSAHFLNNMAAVVAIYLGMGFETKLSTTEFGFSETVAVFTQLVGFGSLLFFSLRAYLRITQPLQLPA